MSGPDPLALAVLGHGVVDPAQPWLHADDAGVLRGRAAFETMRVYGGRPFRLDAHLQRLVGSAQVLGLPAPDPGRLAPLAGEAVSAAATQECVLRVVWTGGREHDEQGVGFALVTPLPDGLEAVRERGVRLATLQLAIGAHARRSSPWRGADDALFLSSEGILLEGPTSNIWFVQGELLCTPSLDLGILAGVTRDTLLAAAGERGITVAEDAFAVERLHDASEIFTSSSVREVMPVVRLDDAEVGDGRPGPVAREMQAALRDAATR